MPEAAPRALPRHGEPRFSDLLHATASAHPHPRLSIGDMLAAMQDRAGAALLFVFAFPNILPTPPGVATILGLPIIFLSAQMVLGRPPHLPRLIAERSMATAQVRQLVARALPHLHRAESLLRHRWPLLTAPLAERLLGVICLALAILLSLPVPLGNLLPSLSVCILALAIMERDGLWVLAGLGAAVVSFLWLGLVSWGVIRAAAFVIGNAF
jgi:hypothetical protein